MTQSQVATFTNADQQLHSIVSDIDEATVTGLHQENKIKVDKIQEHLIAAHAIMHELDYSICEAKDELDYEQISIIIANEAWRMLPDSCKIIMKALKKSYKASLAADVEYHIKKSPLQSSLVIKIKDNENAQ